MAKKTKAELKAKLDQIIKPNGNREITPEKHNSIETDEIDSFLNIVDGGMVVDNAVGYSTDLDIDDDRQFASKRYVDSVASGLVLSAGPGINISSSLISFVPSVNTDGTGIAYFKPQLSSPADPSDGFSLFANSAGDFSWRRKNGTDNYIRTIGGTLTANREYTLQDASYKIAGVDIDNQFSAPQTFKKYIEIDNDITTGLTLSENATNNQTTLTVTNDISMYPQKGVLVVTANSAREYIIYDGLNIANKQFLNCIRGAYGTAALSINTTFPIHLVKFLIPSYSSETVLPVMTVAEGMQNAPVLSALFHYGIGVNRIQDTTSSGGTGQLILQNFLQIQRGGPIDMVYSVSSGNQLYFGTTSTGNLSLVQNGTVRMVVGADILSSVGIKAPSYQVLDADSVTYKVALNSPVTNTLQVGEEYTTVYLPSNVGSPDKTGVDQAGNSLNIRAGKGSGVGSNSVINFITSRSTLVSGTDSHEEKIRMTIGTIPGAPNNSQSFVWLGGPTLTASNYHIGHNSLGLTINSGNIEQYIRFRIGNNNNLMVMDQNRTLITPIHNAKVALAVRGIGNAGNYTQTADLTQWLTYNGTTETVLAKVDKDGKASFPEVHVRSLKLEVASADSDITLGDNWPFMVFTGSVERTWTLPSVVPSNYSKFFFIKNRASANLNIAGTIYFDSAVSSIVLAPGEGLILGASGTYWEVITKLNL